MHAHNFDSVGGGAVKVSTHTCTHMSGGHLRTLSPTSSHTHAHTHTHTYRHTLTHTHTYAHTLTHAHTHTHLSLIHI